MKTFNWTLNCKDDLTHTIELRQADSPRDPMVLSVDGVETELKLPPKSVFVKLEHDFICGGEAVKLMVWGNKADLVFRDVFQSSHKKYQKKNMIPIWVILLVVAINAAIPFVIGANNICYIMAVASICLSYFTSINMLYSRNNKLLKILFIFLMNLAVSFLSRYM